MNIMSAPEAPQTPNHFHSSFTTPTVSPKPVTLIVVAFAIILFFTLLLCIFRRCTIRIFIHRSTQRDDIVLEVTNRESGGSEVTRDEANVGERPRFSHWDVPPPMLYRKEQTTYGSSECPICLSDFVDGEICRMFPICNHIFHLPCIDHWLRDNRTCPVCRFPI